MISNSRSHDENKIKKPLASFNVNFDKYLMDYNMTDIVQTKGSFCNGQLLLYFVEAVVCWPKKTLIFVHAKSDAVLHTMRYNKFSTYQKKRGTQSTNPERV